MIRPTSHRTKLFLQNRLPENAYQRIVRLGHLRPSHRRWAAAQARTKSFSGSEAELLSMLGDTRVRSGPFKGMGIVAEKGWGSDLPARILGTYERELHPVIEMLASARIRHIYDIGCADGYYAVGLALRIPESRVVGYDVDDHALDLTHRNAVLNGVESRVETRGKCASKDLERLPSRSAVFMDCEGSELYLLTDRVAKANPDTKFVIECHDEFDDRILLTLIRRFKDRDLSVIHQESRDPAELPWLPTDVANRAMDEHRGSPGIWLVVN